MIPVVLVWFRVYCKTSSWIRALWYELCVPDIKSWALWYELSVSRIMKHELFDMSSLYHRHHGAWALWYELSVSRIIKHELFDMRSLCHVSQIMSSFIWGLCITDHEYRIMSSMILLATRCVMESGTPSHEFCHMVTVWWGRLYSLILLATQYVFKK